MVYGSHPQRITIYTMPWCHHCTRAKLRLAARGLSFHEVEMLGVPNHRQRLRELTGGMTYPQILIDGRTIGGALDLNRLDRLGVLAAVMRRDPLPIPFEH